MAEPASVVIALCSHVIAESVQMHIQSASGYRQSPVVLARIPRRVSHVELIVRSSKSCLDSELLARKVVIQTTLRH